MGVFTYGPMTALVSDPLGIFQFLVIENEEKATHVFPRVTPLPNLPVRGSKESFNFGLYDVASRGLSSNFIGVRDFEKGDSLRYISWKLSLKARKLLVKEFEKSVNAEITLILDMAAESHMGWKSESTWEYAKDIALSIVSRELANGNQLQLVSNGRHIPTGTGEQHNFELIRAVFNLVPVSDPTRADIVERASTMMRRGTTALYIGPVFRPEFKRTEEALARLKADGMDVVAILLDAGSFVRGKLHGTMKAAVEVKITQGREILQGTVTRLATMGVVTYLISNGCDIGREMLRPNAHAKPTKGPRAP
jgi:uncharacterized protein (DUF58 family)